MIDELPAHAETSESARNKIDGTASLVEEFTSDWSTSLNAEKHTSREEKKKER